MGFRNPITTAVDPVARASADAAGTDAARALTQIIPGSRIAVDALDFKTAVGMTISSATIIGSTVRAVGSGDAFATSTGHALQAGPTNGLNVAVDGNEILARRNGVLSPLFLTSPRASAENEDLGAAPGVAYVTKDFVAGKTLAGSVTITPTAANTPTSATVTFAVPFPVPPTVQVSANSANPGTQVTGVSVQSVTTTGCLVWVTRTNTNPTRVDWLAVNAT